MTAENAALRWNADRRGVPVRAIDRPMPTFFFHIRNGGELTEDPDGSDLPDLAAARAEALVAAREVAAERVKAGMAVIGWSIEVTDGDGRVLAAVNAREILGLD